MFSKARAVLVDKLLQEGKEPILLSMDGSFALEGFYKHGRVRLSPYEEGYIVEGRYGQLGVVNDWEDLVRLNHQEWNLYKSRSSHWTNPENEFIKAMLELGLIEKQVQIIFINK